MIVAVAQDTPKSCEYCIKGVPVVDAITYLPSLEHDIPLQERGSPVEVHVLYLYKGSNTSVKSCEIFVVDVLTERYILSLEIHPIAYCPELDIDTDCQFADADVEADHDAPVLYCKMGVVNPHAVIVPETLENVFAFIFSPMSVPAIL